MVKAKAAYASGHRTIRMKVVTIPSVILFFAVGALTFLIISLYTGEYTSLLESNTYMLAVDLRNKIDKLLDFGIRIDALTNFDKQCREVTEKYDFITYALVADPQGRILHHSDPGRRDASLPELTAFEPAVDFSRHTVVVEGRQYHELLVPVFAGPGARASNNPVGIVGIGYPVHFIQDKIAPVVIYSLLIAAGSFFLSLSVLLYALTRWITRPITHLVSVIRDISEHNNLSRRVDIDSHDEIGQLAETFNTMTAELQKNRAALIEKERVEKELEIAKMIQTSLLPRLDKAANPYYEIAAVMIPADEVGGDYYDILEGFNDRFWIGIGDVAGHGLRSGLVMMMLQTIACAYIRELPGLTPAELISKANRVLFDIVRKRMETGHYMTLSFFTGTNNGEFTFAGKHLPVIIYRHDLGGCELIDVKGFWCGFLPDIAPYVHTGSFTLGRGDMLFLYSDGLTEAMSSAREHFGYERFMDFISGTLQSDPSISCSGLMNRIIGEVFAFMQKQRDDISLMVIRKK